MDKGKCSLNLPQYLGLNAAQSLPSSALDGSNLRAQRGLMHISGV